MPDKWTLPLKTAWMQKQMEHEPSRSYSEEIFNLVSKIKPDYEEALEIGSAWGLSGMAILLAGKGRLTGVDCDPMVKTISEVEANGLQDRWLFYPVHSNKFWKQNDKQYDIVYIDGDHRYEGVRHDLFEGWKVLKSGGLFISDDICHPANLKAEPTGQNAEYGVSLATWEFVKEHKITQIGTTTRLFYCIKP